MRNLSFISPAILSTVFGIATLMPLAGSGVSVSVGRMVYCAGCE